MLVTLLLALSCRTREAVLLAVPSQQSEDGPVEGYVKPEHALVDLNYLAGRSLDEAQAELTAQLGGTVSIQELDPRDGREYTLERGSARVKDGVIYLVRADLPRPMRKSVALHATNIAPQFENAAELSGEVRLRWHGGFERIRMGRSERGSELVVWVEAMRFDPRG